MNINYTKKRKLISFSLFFFLELTKMSNAYKRASLILQKAKGPKWKRELVSDHKFDFMDVDSFRDRTCLLTIRYMILLCSVFISTLVYGADLWSAGILLIYDVKIYNTSFFFTRHIINSPFFLIALVTFYTTKNSFRNQ